MSGLNIFVSPDRVDVDSDGAEYDGDGTILALSQKVAVNAVMPAVFAGRGLTTLVPIIAEATRQRFPTFDALVDGIVDVAEQVKPLAIREATDKIKQTGQVGDIPMNVELYIAGWSASRDRPEAYAVTDTLAQIGVAYLTPADDALIARIRALDIDPLSSPGFDAERDGLAIMREQRRPFPLPSGKVVVGIGGHVLRATVRRDGISMRVIHRWDDRVGSRVAA
jgi:hypothetical protein